MSFIINITKAKIRFVEMLMPLFLLGTRLWVAWVFFKSGMLKYQSYSTTVFLFKEEYKVPLLSNSPEIAAFLGTATELIFPVFLAIGLGGRWSAFILFIFNLIAVYSYPALWENAAGMLQHQLWGFMLLLLVFTGPGKLSIDHFIRRKFMSDAR